MGTGLEQINKYIADSKSEFSLSDEDITNKESGEPKMNPETLGWIWRHWYELKVQMEGRGGEGTKQDSLDKWLIPGGKYKMNLEWLVLPESKEGINL